MLVISFYVHLSFGFLLFVVKGWASIHYSIIQFDVWRTLDI